MEEKMFYVLLFIGFFMDKTTAMIPDNQGNSQLEPNLNDKVVSETTKKMTPKDILIDRESLIMPKEYDDVARLISEGKFNDAAIALIKIEEFKNLDALEITEKFHKLYEESVNYLRELQLERLDLTKFKLSDYIYEYSASYIWWNAYYPSIESKYW